MKSIYFRRRTAFRYKWCDYSTSFSMLEENRSVKTIDWRGNLSIVLICKLEKIVTKGHGNVRKCTKKNIGGSPHIKVYRDGVKSSKRCTFFMSNFERFLIFLRFPFYGLEKKKRWTLCCSDRGFRFSLQLHDGCFDSMDFCVSHTFFISSLTCFTSAA